MNSPGFKICPDCGAECDARANRCWICQQNVTKAPPVVHAEISKATSNQVNETAFLVISLLLLGTMILVGVGLALEHKGLAIAYVVVAAPAIIATAVSLGFSKSTGKVTFLNWFLTVMATFLISTVAVIGVIVLLIVAAIAGLVAFCSSLFQMGQ